MIIKINLRSLLTGLVLVAALAGLIFFVKKSRPAPVPPTPPPYQAALKVKGPDTAPAKLVEFSDFECPSCRVAEEELRNLFRDYPGKIQLTYKHFPLSSHKWSIYAHQASECMNIQGKFWPFHDMVYGKQLEWAPALTAPVETLAGYARQLGADMEKFGKCMAEVEVTRAIYAEKEEGNRRQVNATPTFFLGEERFVGPKELRERGQNSIRKLLGLPPNPVPEPAKTPATAPAPAPGAVQPQPQPQSQPQKP